MKLLDRYVGRELLFTTLFGVAVMTFVLVLGSVFKQVLDVMINQKAPLEMVLSVVAYIVPFSLTYTIPWGFVTAVLLVFGKMSGENELIAMKSSGLSITRICAPLFCQALFWVGICLWINLDFAPRAQNNMKSALLKIATENPLALFGSDSVIDAFPGKKIYAEGKDGKVLKNILVYDLNKGDFGIMRVLYAKKGELRTGRNAVTGEEEVLLDIKDARVEQHDPEDPHNPEKIREGITMKESVFPIPLRELYEKYGRLKVPSQIMPAELWKEAKDLMAGPRNNKTQIELAIILTEINKRFSLSLASFALALISVPLAITAQRKETSVGFLFSIVVGFGYFFFIFLANAWQDHPQFHPELLMWLPNIVFIALGGVLFWRLSRQ